MKQLYQPITLHQLFTRSQLTIFVLTFSICSIFFLVISTYTINAYAKNSLNILSNALNERIQPAVVFNDKITMDQMLYEYTQQYPIRSITIQSSNNKILATSNQNASSYSISQKILDRIFYNTPIKLNIQHDQQNYGYLILYGNSSNLVKFFYKISLGLLIGFIVLLCAVFWSVNSIYQYLMHSIRAIVESAQTISVKKNYNMRVTSSDIQELHALSTAFNGLLSEIEQSNRVLAFENNKLHYQSRHDSLTHLPNRIYFYEKLFQLFETDAKKESAIFFIDINNLKETNEQYGHLAGDNVLLASTNNIKQILPENTFFARLEDDEFAIIIPNITDILEIQQYCKKISDCYSANFIYKQSQISLRTNIGVAFSHLAKSPEDLIADADQAMYDAKHCTEHWHISLQSKNN